MPALQTSKWRRLATGAGGTALAALVLLCPLSARAQTRTSNLEAGAPPLTIFVPGDPAAHALSSGTLLENGPFLTLDPSKTSLGVSLSLNPPAQTSPAWLLAPILETMGDCEGPPSFPQVGNGGSAIHDFGPFGTIQDNFTVTNAGQGSDPTGYQLHHSLSGNLDLRNLPPLDPQAAIDRLTNVTLKSSSATGTVDIWAVSPTTGQAQLIIHGTLNAQYVTAGTAIPIPIPCSKRSRFNALQPGTGNATGFQTRSYSLQAPAAAPALPSSALVLLMLLLGPLGVWMLRRRSATPLV